MCQPYSLHSCQHISFCLGDKSEAAAKLKAVETALVRGLQPAQGKSKFDGGRGQSAGNEKRKADNRMALMEQQDIVAAAQAKVTHFEAMLARNRANTQLASQVAATLQQAQKDLEAAKSEQTRMGRAISGNEAQKKFWGKF